MTTTDVTAQTSAGEGVNTAGTEGTGTQTVQPVERTFKQADLDKIVSDRLAEERTRAQAKHEKALNDRLTEALAAKDLELENQIEQRVQAKLTEQALANQRAALKAEYGLSDEQLGRLAGDTPDALAKDASTLFSHLKTKTPPVILPGSSTTPLPSIAEMSGKDVVANWESVFKQVTGR